MNPKLRKLILAALCLALCIVLPFLTGQIPEIGKRLSPMHIPVFICGFVCGWPWGLAVGLIAPLLRSVMYGMPAFFPNAVVMSFELATYGLVSGILYRLLPRKPWSIYVTLIAGMIAGRIVWGLVKWFVLGLQGNAFTWKMFLAGAVLDAVPGIILHIVLIPAVVLALEKAGFIKQD
jgi:thiamine transporter ThiT